MSTESRSARGGPRGFASTVAATAVVLAIAAGALVAVNLVQGIRLDFTMPPPARFISAAHQSVTLTANQQLRTIDEASVTVTPAADFSLAMAANRLSISFEDTLDYGTEYTVRVADVVGSFDSAPRTVETVFRTPPASVVVLRHGEGGDELVRVPVAGGDDEQLVFEAQQITGFAVAGDRVIVATGDADPAKRLLSVAIAGGDTRSIDLPGEGFASDLDAVAEYGLVGFRFDTDPAADDFEFDRVLFLIENDATPRPAQGLDGEPLTVFDWRFVPAKPAVVAQDLAKDLLLVDLRPDRLAVPLGNYADLVSVGRDGKSVVLGDGTGLSLYDLTRGSVEPISFALDDGQIAYPSDTLALAGDRGVVRSFAVVNPHTHLFEERVTVEAGGETATVFSSGTSGDSVVAVSSSPNDRYLAIETAGSLGQSTTLVVDVGSGEVVTTVPGAGAGWP